MKYIFIFLFLISGKLLAQTPISVKEVDQHIGDSVRIDAIIYGGKQITGKGSPTFLNVGGNYSNAPLTLLIWEEVRNKFQQKDLENYYKGKWVLIYGRITLHKGKPEIVINDVDQIGEITIVRPNKINHL